MSRERPAGDEVRHELYEIMNSEASFEEKTDRALELGKAYLGVENGHLTRINPDTDYWEAIASTDTADGQFPPGLVLDFETTYCRRTLAADSSVALHDAPAQGWADDPAFDAHGLHCYHGTTITVDEETYGTVCFVAEDPREQPFDESETMFAELIARLLEHELERRRHEVETRKRTNLTTVLSRVLRHNLRNDMTVIRGLVTNLIDQLESGEADADIILRKADEIIAISEKARKLEKIVSAEFQREETDLATLVRRVVRETEEDVPAASFAIDTPEEIRVPVMPSLELAVRELVENAAIHGGERPDVGVVVESTPTAVRIHVMDDGPGLPDHERKVLDEGVETPLVHGSGLGLWTVYWIVSSHEGTIETDVSAAGTQITITLPTEPSDPLSVRTQYERELQQGYDRYQAAFDGVFDAMLIFDDDGRILDANAAAADLSGRTTNELLGRLIGTFVRTDSDVEGGWDSLAFAGRERGTATLVPPDGGERVVEYVTTSDIVPGQHLMIARDVTDREARKQQLERTSQRLEAVIEACPDPLAVVDTDGTVERWNRAAEEVFGWTEAEVLGNRPPIIPAEDSHEFEDLLEQASGGDQFRGMEIQRETKGGDFVDVSLSTAPIREADREVTGVVAILRDVTERMARERELAETSKQLQGVLDTAPAAVFMKNTEGEYLLMNQNARDLVGLDSETSVTGKTDYELFPEEVAKKFRSDDRAVLNSAETVTVVEKVPTQTGRRTHLTVKRPVFDAEDDLYGLCAVSMDVTRFGDIEQRLAENASS